MSSLKTYYIKNPDSGATNIELEQSGNLTVGGGVNASGIVTATDGSFSGDISAVGGTFSGNVSVGGTLTYEDVTNVDSVGLITARSGIKFGTAGVGGSITAGGDATFAGIVTATSFSGDGSNLGGIESGVSNFVASGTISNGTTVIINEDGTVSAVAGSGTPGITGGTTSTYTTNSLQGTEDVGITYDPDQNRVIICYRDGSNSDYGTAVVGSVSGTVISFGTPVVYQSDQCFWNKVVYDTDNNKVIPIYRSANGTAGPGVYGRVGTVSGNSISFPDPSVGVHAGSNVNYVSAAYTTNGKTVVIMQDSAGISKVVTTSGDSLTVSSAAQFYNSSIQSSTVAYDSINSKVIVCFGDGSTTGYICKGTVGTTMNWQTVPGTSTVQRIRIVNSGTIPSTFRYPNAIFDPDSGKVIIIYRGMEGLGYAVVVDASPTNTVNIGSPVVFNTVSDTDYPVLSYDSGNKKVVISFSSANTGLATKSCTVVGNTLILGDILVIHGASTVQSTASVYNSVDKRVVVTYQYTSGSGANQGKAKLVDVYSATTNLTSENYIGIAAEAISNGATGKINISGGINTGQIGLTTSRKYYVQHTGGLSTTPSDPEVVAGTSVSSTNIIVKG